jgi:hypothetical protein
LSLAAQTRSTSTLEIAAAAFTYPTRRDWKKLNLAHDIYQLPFYQLPSQRITRWNLLVRMR